MNACLPLLTTPCAIDVRYCSDRMSMASPSGPVDDGDVMLGHGWPPNRIGMARMAIRVMRNRRMSTRDI